MAVVTQLTRFARLQGPRAQLFFCFVFVCLLFFITPLVGANCSVLDFCDVAGCKNLRARGDYGGGNATDSLRSS